MESLTLRQKLAEEIKKTEGARNCPHLLLSVLCDGMPDLTCKGDYASCGLHNYFNIYGVTQE
jgi:hypothetical protein